MGMLVNTLLGVLAFGVIAFSVYGLHRLCIRLENAGLIYYRQKPSGGGGAPVLMELDRLTRPSVEHVVATQDVEKRVERPGVDGD